MSPAPRRESRATSLTDNDTTKLAAILGMLGSNHAGERDAAALAACRFIRERGLQWLELLQPDAIAPDDPFAPFGGWRKVATFCAKEGRGSVSYWEIAFCGSLTAFVKPSEKQLSILSDCCDKLMLAEVAP